MTLLIVEDDEGISHLLKTVLSRHGFDVDSVGDGATGIARLRSNDYSAVLLDLMLPKINGFEVIHEMRSWAPELLRRTIIITAASEATLRDFDRSQVFALLRKPFDLGELVTTIHACVELETRRLAAQAL
jgi:DNA-binding response OmpR family regulator